MIYTKFHERFVPLCLSDPATVAEAFVHTAAHRLPAGIDPADVREISVEAPDDYTPCLRLVAKLWLVPTLSGDGERDDYRRVWLEFSPTGDYDGEWTLEIRVLDSGADYGKWRYGPLSENDGLHDALRAAFPEFTDTRDRASVNTYKDNGSVGPSVTLHLAGAADRWREIYEFSLRYVGLE